MNKCENNEGKVVLSKRKQRRDHYRAYAACEALARSQLTAPSSCYASRHNFDQ